MQSTILQHENLKHVQNAVDLCISVFTIYSIYSNTFTTIIPCIFCQCIFELFICPIDVIIHHILVIAILYSFVFNIIQISEYQNEFKIFLSVEISSIFLIINNYLGKNKLIHPTLIILNQFCFISSFFYTRIYLYTKYIIIIKIEPYILLLIYLFFILNCYWFAIIVKKVVKPIHEYITSMPTYTSMITSITSTDNLSTYIIALSFIIDAFWARDHNHRLNIFIYSIMIFSILLIKPFYSWNPIVFFLLSLLRNVT